ncbi:hypothetical protein HJC23_009220 [Cyclotella cryptica]|uniref:Serpin domain-containing protein n=1 Tax=Cyclotella cryptica TaxID=29204 RepID=A0ABD3P0R1_9STRA
MRAILIISSLAAFAITDGRTIRGAKRDSTERGIRGAVRRCYPIFNQFEECMTNAADDCSREREDYFSCLCQDCDLSFAETSNDASTETRAAITSSNVTSSSFGAALFAQLCDASPETNVLISPLSVYRALELVEDGATANKLREQVKAVIDSAGSGVQLNMATSVWADDLKTSYMDHLMTEHSAEAFSLPETYGPVDDWIEEKTNGKIKVLMGDGALDPLTAALLVDAVYFKGTWKYEFSPVDTTDDVFYHRDGSQTSAKYMKASRTMEAIKSTPLLGDASFVVLDYGEDAEFAALFILPGSSSKESMDDVIAGLTSHSISELVEEATEVNVNLKLPRFHLAFGPSQLKPHLMNMGMKIAFDPDVLGKFNRMSYDRGLYVDDVHHGACMEVNEEGTEAAAATVVDMMYRGLPRDDESVKLTFDRPFVVVIFQRSSGIPLFMGRVEDPDFI